MFKESVAQFEKACLLDKHNVLKYEACCQALLMLEQGAGEARGKLMKAKELAPFSAFSCVLQCRLAMKKAKESQSRVASRCADSFSQRYVFLLLVVVFFWFLVLKKTAGGGGGPPQRRQSAAGAAGGLRRGRQARRRGATRSDGAAQRAAGLSGREDRARVCRRSQRGSGGAATKGRGLYGKEKVARCVSYAQRMRAEGAGEPAQSGAAISRLIQVQGEQSSGDCGVAHSSSFVQAKGNPAEVAVRDAKHALRLHHGLADAWLALGVAYAKLGHVDWALEAVEEGERQDPRAMEQYAEEVRKIRKTALKRKAAARRPEPWQYAESEAVAMAGTPRSEPVLEMDSLGEMTIRSQFKRVLMVRIAFSSLLLRLECSRATRCAMRRWRSWRASRSRCTWRRAT